jgi:hypothetical protein
VARTARPPNRQHWESSSEKGTYTKLRNYLNDVNEDEKYIEIEEDAGLFLDEGCERRGSGRGRDCRLFSFTTRRQLGKVYVLVDEAGRECQWGSEGREEERKK